MRRFNRVLLVQLLHHGGSLKRSDPFISPGLGSISESLYKEGLEHNLFDTYFGNVDKLLKKIKEFAPDLVGIRMMTFHYKKSYEIIKTIKSKYKDIKIVIGGPHISTMRESVMEECREIDFGIVLEGEETITELCSNKALDTIKGLIYRENGTVRYTGNREVIQKLDNVSYPKYKMFPLERYLPSENTPIPIITSRGCPYRCTYCAVALVIGTEFRTRGASNVVDELEYWYSKGRLAFSILDDNFTLVKRRVLEICDEIEKKGLKELKISVHGIRADKVDKRLLQRMKAVGFVHLSFGVEAASNSVLHNLKKGEDIVKIERAIKLACELGFSVDLFFLVGSPTETWQDIEDSVKLALKYPIANVKFFNIIPYPHTELYDWLVKNNYLVYSPEYYLNNISPDDEKPLFFTPELSISDRKKALHYTRGVTILVRMRKYRKKFARCGVLADVLSRLAVSNMVDKGLMAYSFTRKLLRRFGRLLTSSMGE